MQQLQLSEGTAAQRRLFFHAVDATDGLAPETGLTGTGFLSKNGATPVATSGSLNELNSTNMPGRYYIEFTAAELNTVGIIEFRFKAAACAEVIARAQIVPFDPYDAVRMGLTALPNAAAEAAGGLYTRGTGAGQINQQTNGEINANIARVLNVVINALVSGRVDASVGAMAANVLTATAINADAITAAKVADGTIDAATFAAGAIDATAIATGAIDADAIAANAITAAKINADAIDATKVAAGTIDAATFAAGAIDAAALATDAVDEIRDAILDIVTGTADAGSSNVLIVDAERTETVTDYWQHSVVEMTGGPNVGQVRRITAFDAGTDTITVAPAFKTAVGTGDTYRIIRVISDGLRPITEGNETVDVAADGDVGADVQTWLDAAVNALATGRVDASVGVMAADVLTAAAIADNAIDAATFATGAIDANAIAANAIDAAAIATGAIDADAIAANAITAAKIATAAIDADAIAANAITAGKIAADAITAAKVAADVHAEAADAVWDEDIVAAHGTADTTGLLLRAIGALISQRTNNATLNALLGISDVASQDLAEQLLRTETFAELTTVVGATPTLEEFSMWLFMSLRNKATDDGTTVTMSNDAETVIAKATIANVAGTATREEWVAGP